MNPLPERQTSETPSKSELLPAHRHSAPLQSSQEASERVKESGIYDRYDRDWSPLTNFGKAFSIVLGPKDIVRTIDKARKKLKEGVNDVITRNIGRWTCTYSDHGIKKLHGCAEKMKEWEKNFFIQNHFKAPSETDIQKDDSALS